MAQNLTYPTPEQDPGSGGYINAVGETGYHIGDGTLVTLDTDQSIPGFKTFDAIRFDNTPTLPSTMLPGDTFWDAADMTLATTLDVTNGVTLQHGQELHTRAVNKTGAPIENGKVVYVSGAQGNRPKITLAKSDAYSTACVIGVTTQAIANNAEGFVTIAGLVRGVDTSGFSDGDVLYLSPTTAGLLTNTPPVSPNYTTHVATALNSTVNGLIVMHVQEPIALDPTLGAGSATNRVAPSQKAVYDAFLSPPSIGSVAPSTAKFGGGTDYTEFEADGTLVSKGAAVVWKDIDFSILIRTTGAGIPTLTTLNGNLLMPNWAVNDFNQCESQEFVHEWLEGSTCYWHLHMTTNGLDIADRYVKFELEYGYANVDGTWTFPAVVTTADMLIPANTADKTMMIMSLANFTPAGIKIGGHCIARLKRVTATGTAPTNNPWIPMLQMHIQCDTLGSRLIATK